jgi:hypothetical protein
MMRPSPSCLEGMGFSANGVPRIVRRHKKRMIIVTNQGEVSICTQKNAYKIAVQDYKSQDHAATLNYKTRLTARN